MVLASAACSGSPTFTDTPEPPVEYTLRPSSELMGGCYEFPPSEVIHTDHVTLGISVTSGDIGIDFCLKDTAGEEHRLSDLIATRPVVIVFGAFS